MTTPRDDTHGNAAHKSDKNIQFIRIYLYNVLRSNIILSHTHPCCINVDVEILAAGQVLGYLLNIMPTCVHWRLPLTGSFSISRMKSFQQPGFNRNRLPNLSEVLNELTSEPVDLRSFLEFMQDQKRSGDYLDFL